MSHKGGPATIYIIRHGEKLGDPTSDTDGGPDLSVRGSARAAALPSLFLPAANELSCKIGAQSGGYSAEYSSSTLTGDNPRFSTPHVLYATLASTHSNRPVETITPLTAALGLTCNSTYADDPESMKDLEAAVMANSSQVVLICWHHGTIQSLAQLFGIKSAPKWDGTVFDRVWEITVNPGPLSLIDQPQQLLFGDSDA